MQFSSRGKIFTFPPLHNGNAPEFVSIYSQNSAASVSDKSGNQAFLQDDISVPDFPTKLGKNDSLSLYGGGGGGDGGGGAKQNIHFFSCSALLHGQGKSINLTHPSCSRSPQNEGDSRIGTGPECCPPGTSPQMATTTKLVSRDGEKPSNANQFSRIVVTRAQGKNYIAKCRFLSWPAAACRTFTFGQENTASEVKSSR